ncbi:ferredoxin reductase family protein [Coralliovum pocilloporae]|uniref:ferredoxin reductase family protein n=1 Tax=Coralliovum pocilloporae TaxID=3066369 RepID=UPI0033076D1F
MRITGILIIIAALVIPLPWFFELAPRFDGGALFSQYLGASALILMAIIQLQATRMRWLETVFGSLDRIYILHKWSAVLAIGAVLLHDTLDAEFKVGNENSLSDLAEQLGEFSYYGLLILGAASVVTLIPYRIWRWSHRFIGIFFILGATHYVLIEKPFNLTDPIGVYILGFCILGSLSYIACLFRASLMKGGSYKVASIERSSSLNHIILEPGGKHLGHKAGQFAFLKFHIPGFNETHPFTISSGPQQDGTLRFSIASLGDYTGRLASQLRVGSFATVHGGYGHFLAPRSKGLQIWIGAGAGVTPYLAWLQALSPETHREIHLYICGRGSRDRTIFDEFTNSAKRLPQVTLHLIDTDREPRLTSSLLQSTHGDTLKNATVAFCGPTQMRKTLAEDLVQLGHSRRRFLYEAFELRTGLGLGAPLLRLIEQLFGSHERLIMRFRHYLPRKFADPIADWLSVQLQQTK